MKSALFLVTVGLVFSGCGADTAADVYNVIQSTLNSLQIPDVSGRASLGSYTMSNIALTSVAFTPQNFALTDNGDGTYGVSISGVSISVSADWTAVLDGFSLFPMSGDLTVTAAGLGMDLGVTVDATTSPITVGVNTCTSSVGSVDINLKGSIFASLIESKAEKVVKEALPGELCSAISTYL